MAAASIRLEYKHPTVYTPVLVVVESSVVGLRSVSEKRKAWIDLSLWMMFMSGSSLCRCSWWDRARFFEVDLDRLGM
jgi:hypothetical protein